MAVPHLNQIEALLYRFQVNRGDRPIWNLSIGSLYHVGEMAEQIGMSRQGLQKALSDDGNPRFGNITALA